MRMLARPNSTFKPFPRTDTTGLEKQTDLHTHHAGCLSPEDLIYLGLKHNIYIPQSVLEENGISCSKYKKNEDGDVSLISLAADKEAIKQYADSMRIPNIKQETFNKLEDIYNARKPFTKNPVLFEDTLRQIAKRYGENGITYVELSATSIVERPEELEVVHRIMPEIEKETGCKVRFLAAVSRHSAIEKIEDNCDRIMAIAKDPYVVGMDFLGHETNSTKTFGNALKRVAKWSMLNDQSFTLRVHAGESPLFADNVKDVLSIVKQSKKELEEDGHKDLIYPEVRIGHGLYGVTDETLSLCKELDAIVEFNISSNLALNNLDSLEEVPIKKYDDKGIRFVLGSDGYGLYNTFAQQGLILTQATGLSRGAFLNMQQTERDIIAKKQTQFNKEMIVVKKRLLQGDAFADLYPVTFTGENNQSRYTEDVKTRDEEEVKRIQQFLHEEISKCGAQTDEEQIAKDIEGKKPILISGASAKSWSKISEEHQDEIRTAMNVLVNVIDPQKAFLVTGGINQGVEKQAHEMANAYNKQAKNKIIVLGTLTEAAATRDVTSIDRDTITHATILSLHGKIAKKWFDLPDTVLSFVEEKQGTMIAIGGGAIVRDMIQRAHNMKFEPNLMQGPQGASTAKAKIFPKYAFEGARGLIERLYKRNPDIFKKDFNIDNLDEIILSSQHQQRNLKRLSLMNKEDKSVRYTIPKERALILKKTDPQNV
ncbi:MAG: hypothetical protein R3Y43_06385 [Alphaproteobacteria bacterium]